MSCDIYIPTTRPRSCTRTHTRNTFICLWRQRFAQLARPGRVLCTHLQSRTHSARAERRNLHRTRTKRRAHACQARLSSKSHFDVFFIWTIKRKFFVSQPTSAVECCVRNEVPFSGLFRWHAHTHTRTSTGWILLKKNRQFAPIYARLKFGCDDAERRRACVAWPFFPELNVGCVWCVSCVRTRAICTAPIMGSGWWPPAVGRTARVVLSTLLFWLPL